MRCPACGFENPAGMRFCGNCGRPLGDSRASVDRRVVTILFADVIASTQLSGILDAERLREQIGGFFGIAREEIERFGGTIEKYIGDAVMAVFGLPSVHENDPERAVQAAWAILGRTRAYVSAGVIPDVRIGVAHGQMDEEGLSLAMDDFAARRSDLLLCTAIIEAGLDIANANTILVNHAHRFGLAQLYQLRGRVGRDRHRAYAYFLLPKDVAMTRHATQRLAVLEELTELGSGFRIASHDLEIRGAGNLLGKDQSGQIHQVGYELYTQLLAEAMAELSGNAAAEEEEPELDLRIPAFLPDDYIPEAGVRLEFYRKLAMAKTVDAADELELELLDRFGRLPGPAKALCDLSRLRVRMREAGVRELKRGNGALYLTVSDRSEVDRGLLVRWVTREKSTFSFVRGEVLAMKVPGDGPEAVLSAAKNLLNRFPPGRNI